MFSEAASPEVITGGAVIPPERLRDAQALRASRPHLGYLPAHYVASLLDAVEAGEYDFEDTELDGNMSAGPPDALVDGPAQAVTVGTSHGVFEAVNDGPQDGAASNGEGAESQNRDETYDERVQRLRQECVQMAGELARALDIPVGRVHTFYRRELGIRPSEASLAQILARRDIMRRKLQELQYPQSG